MYIIDWYDPKHWSSLLVGVMYCGRYAYIYAYYIADFNHKNKKETSLIRSVLLFFLSNSYKRYLHYNDTNTFFFHDVKLPISLLNILDL